MVGDRASVGERPVPVVAFFRLALARWKLLVFVPLLAGAVAALVALLLPPIFTARTTFLPAGPGDRASSLLGSLGGLAGLAGAAVGTASTSDQFVALLGSRRVADALVDRHDLVKVYASPTRTDARRELERNTRIGAGRKDALVTIEVDDGDPQRAAAMANQYVAELRSLAGGLALTEAQRRRMFFEGQLAQARDKLDQAQEALQKSGFGAGALRSAPDATAQAYGRALASLKEGEIKLQALRQSLADQSPEVRQQQAAVTGLRANLASLERQLESAGGGDYVARARDYKYQETLFEILARQYETARLEESREASLIQVVDVAQPPERRSSPKRTLIVVVTVAATLAAALAWLLIVHLWRLGTAAPASAPRSETS